jgi:gluconate 5-dehydrogenase
MITSATRGISLGAAEALAKSGANLMLVGQDKRELERGGARLRKFAAKVEVLPFNLMEITSISEWTTEIFAMHGTPNIIVNSAGLQRRGPQLS